MAVVPDPAVNRAAVTSRAVTVAEHAALVAVAAAGAVVTFDGVVRDHDEGRPVERLIYTAHPSAGAIVLEIARRVADLSGVHGVAVSHRVGELRIGETALACAVSAEHRHQAFAACAELVEEVKRRIPVWKRQIFADGREEWVGCA